MKIDLLNIDCLDYMREQPDNSFDLIVADPPFGMPASALTSSQISATGVARKSMDLRISETIANKYPPREYYHQAKRIARNQIIWGWNYLLDTDTGSSAVDFGSGRLVWNKNNPVLSGAEIAYQSFTNGVKVFNFTWSGFCKAGNKKSETIYPTQKPIDLYSWIYQKYSANGQRVLDTHLGSGSSAIAAHYFGLDFVGIELDKQYFDSAIKRFDAETSQLDLFVGGAR